MESKFKIGDRVAVKRRRTGVVNEIYPSDKAKNIYVIALDKGGFGTAWENEIEEAKAAFLSELKGLLEKYDAFMIAHKTDMPLSVYFEGEEMPFARVGKEGNKNCGVIIEPRTITNDK